MTTQQTELMQKLAIAGNISSKSTYPNYWTALYQMSKPTITMLVVFTTWPTIVLASRIKGIPIDFSTAFCALVGTALMSASAAIFNQLIDLSIDKKMHRTKNRPLPKATMTPATAIISGFVLAMVGWVILFGGSGQLTAQLALAANAFYVIVYTAVLKKRTVQNIVIGGAAGAVGPLIGWAAVTGGIGWPAFWMFLVIFLWTPPHFWALALKYKEDYREAGIPMMPVIKGIVETKRQMFNYSLLLIPTVLLAQFSAGLTGFSLYLNLTATVYFAVQCWQLKGKPGTQGTMAVFAYSCAYLFIVFGLYGAEAWLRV